ncbi:hypothetical protein ABMA27_010357 [Loxostege sticticalis]|uniref:Reverse transcriptase domain-containing protein n=1 Tax=Loxostege sticticalis TaxID=481309 RepID=A0ABR3H5G6_LOXSC
MARSLHRNKCNAAFCAFYVWCGNEVIWGERDLNQIEKYHTECNSKLREIDFPVEFSECCDGMCNNSHHRTLLDKMYDNIICIISNAAASSYRHAGVHLPRVLSLFFNLCLGHSYVPEGLMHTIVVPIIKNKTGDSSDVNNYRPISLATVIAKVLDSLLSHRLDKHISLNDVQFGFRAGLSTESAILCLKQTVRYYTARKTPVYACYLDLSKAFDLVSYEILWRKMKVETDLPNEIIALFKHWYDNQKNNVRWAGCLSEDYRLECGVRQGGLSSPTLFNLYINRLIDELSSTGVGCHIDGICVNNISYADDMVLLSPSCGALETMLCVCESYAAVQGLKYNTAKSEFMVFKPDNKRYNYVPKITLCGFPLKKVERFKNIERERRALSVRCNMLARRFARCTKQVKLTLFRAFCQAYSDLRVQYNNAFRVLMGLPRYCSASAMFAEAHTDGFAAIMRNYADDMALLSPSIGGLRKMLLVCEQYARDHGLMYNCKKSEVVLFATHGVSNKHVPPIRLNGEELNIVPTLKYLGHVITADLRDDCDIGRERRALAVRVNMLARRFARCSFEVKISLFKSYCQSFYTSGLFCSASGMFADAHVVCFHALMRKKIISIQKRMLGSPNSILRGNLTAERNEK